MSAIDLLLIEVFFILLGLTVWFIVMQPPLIDKTKQIYAKSAKRLSARVDDPDEWVTLIIRGFAGLSIVLGILAFMFGKPNSSWPELWPELVGIGVTVAVIDELNRWRQAEEYKRSIKRQMASQSNAFALDAARIAKQEGWLTDGSFTSANLSNANLRRADLSGDNLEGVDLSGANLYRANLKSANLQGACMQRVEFLHANLVDANLQGAHMHRATFQEASLEGARLSDSDLTQTNLGGTDFHDSDLQNANLKGAFLAGANFRGANMQGADLRGAGYDNRTSWPDGLDVTAAGVFNYGEMNGDEQAEWHAKYHS